MKYEKLVDKSLSAFCLMVAAPDKAAAYKAVCLLRSAAVRVLDEYVRAGEKRRYLDRLVKRCPAPELPEGTSISIQNPFELYEKRLYQQIIELGEMLLYSLDYWEKYGATLEELKVLCNGGGEYWYRVVTDADKGFSFSKIVFACNPDYKNKGDFLETTPDAPLTICLKEFMIDRLLHTEHGRKVSREAMDKFFPEIMANAIYPVVDSEGTVHYLNKDGVEYEPPKK